MIFNHLYEYKINLTFEICLSNSQLKITIVNGFRVCLDYSLIDNRFHVPFYNNILIGNYTNLNKTRIEQIENIIIIVHLIIYAQI